MTTDVLLGAWMVAAACAYVVTGGADFGGGVWDLFARGPRAREQRRAIEQAIAPIWEANHVWLIALVVVLFSCFPPAFAVVSTALHIPLTLLLIGIVARGASFTFRTYDDASEDLVQKRWGRIFSVSSTITPVLLGVVVGSLATAGIEVEDGIVTSGFFAPWATSPFPWAAGAFTLALFAFLAAAYLTVETEGALREDFRKRAIVAWAITAVVGVITLLLAARYAPVLFRGITGGAWAIALFASTAVAAGVSLVALLRGRFALARVAAAVEVTLVVLGFCAGQYPYLVADDVTLASASAPANVQLAIFVVLTAGTLPLLLALRYLFRVFKSRQRSGREREI